MQDARISALRRPTDTQWIGPENDGSWMTTGLNRSLPPRRKGAQTRPSSPRSTAQISAKEGGRRGGARINTRAPLRTDLPLESSCFPFLAMLVLNTDLAI